MRLESTQKSTGQRESHWTETKRAKITRMQLVTMLNRNKHYSFRSYLLIWTFVKWKCSNSIWWGMKCFRFISFAYRINCFNIIFKLGVLCFCSLLDEMQMDLLLVSFLSTANTCPRSMSSKNTQDFVKFWKRIGEEQERWIMNATISVFFSPKTVKGTFSAHELAQLFITFNLWIILDQNCIQMRIACSLSYMKTSSVHSVWFGLFFVVDDTLPTTSQHNRNHFTFIFFFVVCFFVLFTLFAFDCPTSISYLFALTTSQSAY